MKRRRFIKIAGGGVILAAIPSPGCDSGMPDEAIRPWKTAGQPDDVRKWALSHAILAPHSHNLQSWLVDLSTPGEIVLFCDLTRLLPETDPMYRQIVMSQGTFLELFEIAAREKGYRSDIELFPDGTYGPDTIDKRAVARIRLVEHPSVLKDPLFSQILKRRTNREEYDASRDIPKPAIEAMAASIDPYKVKFGFAGTEDSAMMEKQRALAKEALRIELTTPAKILETYRYLRIGPDEIAKYRDGISINDPFLGFLVKLGLFDRSKAPAPDSFATTGQIETFNKNLSTTPGFLWMITEGNTL